MKFQTSPQILALGAFVPALLSACAASPLSQSQAQTPLSRTKKMALTLAQDGRTDYVIALAQGAIPAECTAASELRLYLESISGAKFVVKNEGEVDSKIPQILIGTGRQVKKLLPAQTLNSLGPDGICIQTVGKNLILTGARPRGSLYAVYTLLENNLGVRWWTPDERTVPQKTLVRIEPQSLVYTPQLRMREAYYHYAVAGEPHFATTLKLNGDSQRQPAELGGHYSILGGSHTFIQLLPPQKYFKEHPEWYSDPSNGDKPCTALSPLPAPHTWQLCLSNEEARLELTKNALEWIRKNPEAGMISISQNDSEFAHCMCAADVTREKHEGSPSGPLLHFVNLVAADIEKEYPGFLVETLAYNYSRKPPLYERPRHNVVLRLCATPINIVQPIESEANASFREDVSRWSQIAPRLFVWNYLANFGNYLVPHPNLNNLGRDIRFFTANKTIALFEQGDVQNAAGDFTGLRVWLLGHLMWDPRLDQNKLTDEYLNGYFGAAGVHLRRYLDIIQHSGLGFKLGMYEKEYPYLTLEVMNAATQAFDAAGKAVEGDASLSKRVLRERLTLDHAWILRYRELRQEAKTRNVEFLGPQDLASFIKEYIRNAREFQIQESSEGVKFEYYLTHGFERYSLPVQKKQ